MFTKITTGFLTGNLITDDDGLDVDNTVATYARLLTRAIQSAYPSAEVSVDWEGAEGCVPFPLQTAVDGADDYEEEAAIIDDVDNISEMVFSAGEFYVTA